MTSLDGLKTPLEFKQSLRDTFTIMIKELVDMETQVIATCHNNPTVPFDYNLTLREINAEIACKKEVYLRLTGEILD